MLDRELELLGRLPPPARDILERLVQAVDDGRAILRAASEAARETKAELRAAQQNLAYAKAVPQRDQSVEDGLRRTIKASYDELTKRERLVAEREAAVSPLVQLL